MPTLAQKVDSAQALIARCLKTYRRMCVLWSGGKDSQVLLHMVRQTGDPIDVICWREPWLPAKQAFTNKIIQMWNLTVWDWSPVAITLCKGNGRIDVMNHYSFGLPGRTMILARGTEPPSSGEPWLCGRDTFMRRPLVHFPVPWDLAFHGHRSTDVDPCSGPVPLEVDVMDTPGMTACAYPLRNWTDEDVFQYIELEDVPYDTQRYYRAPGGWQVLPYQSTNPDYIPACMKCLDPDEGEFVFCPKLKAQINNISASVVWEKPRLSYCGLRTKEEMKA